MAIKHVFQSAKSDGGDTTLVRPSNWNADHEVTNYVDLPEISSPSNPSSGFVRFFAKAGALLYKRTSAGVETEVGAGGAASAATEAAGRIYAHNNFR